jgi:peptidyl-prolyl cis-trans isomerase SurA
MDRRDNNGLQLFLLRGLNHVLRFAQHFRESWGCIMTRRALFFLVLLAIVTASIGAQAQRVKPLPTIDVAPRPAPTQTHEAPYEERIAAVVNDTIVSTSDLRARISLAILSSGLPETSDVKRHLLPQVLRGLIDEQLQMQEGKRLEVTVAQDEIQQTLKRLADDNRIPGGDMAAFLTAHGVPSSTLVNQVRAALTWSKVVQRELRPRVDVGDDEIDAAIERMRANAGKQEYLVSEIYLAVDNPKEEDQVKNFAENLVQQIKGGANFGAIARQFSQGTGASGGGDMGWIQTGQLAPELDKMLQTLQSGEVAGPVRSANGFHILGMREKRTIAPGAVKNESVGLQQAFRPFAPDQTKETLLKEAARLRQSVDGCKDLQSKLAQDFPAWRWQDLGEVKMSDAPSWLADKVRDISVGHASEAMATDKGALMLFVCGRTAPEIDVNRNEILNTIGTERMELLARRLLRDLRRSAYIDIRLAPSMSE